MDGFHLADVALEQLGRRERKGAPDTFDAGGYAALLMRLAAGEEVWAPAFERDLEQPLAQAIHVGREAEVIVSEGNYLLLHAPEWRAVRRWFDEVWFCALDDELRRERLIARHIEFGKDPDAGACLGDARRRGERARGGRRGGGRRPADRPLLLSALRGGYAASAASTSSSCWAGLTLRKMSLMTAVRADHERRALVAHVRAAVHRLLDPHAVGLGDRVVLVAEQREAEANLSSNLAIFLGASG